MTLLPRNLVSRGPALWALLVLAGFAVLFWFLWLVSLRLARQRLSGTLKSFFVTFVVAGLLLGVVVVVLPGLAWVMPRVWKLHAPATGASAGGAALLTYVTVLFSTTWRRVETVKRAVGSAERSRLVRAVPNGFSKYLLVWAVLLAVTAASLLVLGWVTATGWSWPVPCQIVLSVGLGLVVLSLDQTWMSLHPFYRARWPPRSPSAAGPARTVNRSRWYGRRHGGFPQVIFAAAANLSGNDRTPPGRHAVSFTLSHDYVGGPDVGYARTDVLCRRTRPVIRKDLTVESAVAVSGSAFASAAGRQSRAFQTLFALSNTRLDTWPQPRCAGRSLGRAHRLGPASDAGDPSPALPAAGGLRPLSDGRPDAAGHRRRALREPRPGRTAPSPPPCASTPAEVPGASPPFWARPSPWPRRSSAWRSRLRAGTGRSSSPAARLPSRRRARHHRRAP
ncbi:hypothetical protein [Streptomyces sp. S186]|uniref:hypothetical protein n=1 Tax=Streptomyces sp. S186 TaxID=3434395 RepID=UPI003F67641A